MACPAPAGPGLGHLFRPVLERVLRCPRSLPSPPLPSPVGGTSLPGLEAPGGAWPRAAVWPLGWDLRPETPHQVGPSQPSSAFGVHFKLGPVAPSFGECVSGPSNALCFVLWQEETELVSRARAVGTESGSHTATSARAPLSPPRSWLRAGPRSCGCLGRTGVPPWPRWGQPVSSLRTEDRWGREAAGRREMWRRRGPARRPGVHRDIRVPEAWSVRCLSPQRLWSVGLGWA